MTKRWMSLGLVGAAAVVAVGAGAVAVNAASPGTGRTVLSENDVARQLAAEPAGPALTATSTVTGDGATKVLHAPVGTVVVGCKGSDQAVILRWTPKTGFEVNRTDIGPARAARLGFESGGTEYLLLVTCHNGTPQASLRAGNRHGGNGDAGSGSDDPPGHH